MLRLIFTDLRDLLDRGHGRSIRCSLLDITTAPLRRRPHTDDMIQMCDDIGVDVPDHNWFSRDGQAVYLR